MNLATAIGDSIRTARMEKGMTLRDLSAKSHISLGYLSEVERGTKEVSSVVLDCVAQGLSLPLYKIVGEASRKLRDAEEFDYITRDVELDTMEKVLTW
jgi:transcriptional regulator with XRE-family HTH domain